LLVIVLLMGVTGVGKTTVGRALASELHWRFVDADEYHSAASVAKMRAGIPLDDADRAPWLQALHDAIVAWLDAGENVVLACSALKASYRSLLLVGPEVRLVYLTASHDLIATRLSQRADHYMNPALLRSQFDTLEEPQDAITVVVDQPTTKSVEEIRSKLGL
jgi:gluconokinase